MEPQAQATTVEVMQEEKQQLVEVKKMQITQGSTL